MSFISKAKAAATAATNKVKESVQDASTTFDQATLAAKSKVKEAVLDLDKDISKNNSIRSISEKAGIAAKAAR